MRVFHLLLLVSGSLFVAAQSNTVDPLDLFISEAYSVYTQVTSILASAASAASVAGTASSAVTTASLSSASATASTVSEEDTTSSDSSSARSTATNSGSSTSSPSSTGSSSPTLTATSSASKSTLASSQLSSVGSTSIQGAAAETGTPAPLSSTSSNGHNRLAIILGSVLGILALGLFILALVLCRKRRQHRNFSPRHSALSPGDDEVDSWRVRDARRFSGSHVGGGNAAAPLMTEHPAYRSRGEHQNPFVPVPPPPRRSAPNSRVGLTDGMTPGQEPYLEKEIGGPLSTASSRDSSHHRKGALAAGIAGAAVGAGLMHHHKSSDDEKTLVPEEEPADSVSRSRPRSITRKPVPLNHVNNSEPWPYSPVSPIDQAAETALLAKTPSRTSGESRRSFHRDAARANAAFDEQYSPHVRDEDEHNGHAVATGAYGLAAGALGGAAMAHHHDKRRSRSSSSSGSGSERRRSGQSYRNSQSQSPHRPGVLTPPEGSDHSGSSNSSNNNTTYNDALVTQPPTSTPLPPPTVTSRPSNPRRDSDPDPSTIPPAPPTRSRRNSALGTMAPSAAVYSYANRPAIPSPLSTELLPDGAMYTSHPHPHPLHQHQPPAIPAARMPSRSPRRSSRGRSTSQDYTAYDAYSTNPWIASAQPLMDEPAQLSTLNSSSDPDKAIVGDNGYPHMGIPRRKSGGEYDYPSTGPFGPQILPAPVHGSKGGGGSGDDSAAGTRTTSMASDDSAWRVSSGMPGGWTRARSTSMDGSASRRVSGELRRPARLRASDMRTGHDVEDIDHSDVGRGATPRYYAGVGQAM